MKQNITEFLNLKASVFTLILLILVSLGGTNAKEIVYTFEEDFSGSDFSHWKFEGSDWSSGHSTNHLVENITASIGVTDGKLTSTRNTNQALVYDWASHPINQKNGVWQFTAEKDPSTLKWGFFLSQGEIDWIGTNADNRLQNVIYVFFDSTQLIFSEFDQKDGTTTVFSHTVVLNSTYTRTNQEYLYQISRNEEAIEVYMDYQLVGNYTLLLTFDEFIHFGILTEFAITVDSFKVTEDFSILQPPSTESDPPTSDSSAEGDNSAATTEPTTTVTENSISDSETQTDEGLLSTNQSYVVVGLLTMLVTYKIFFSKKNYPKN